MRESGVSSEGQAPLRCTDRRPCVPGGPVCCPHGAGCAAAVEQRPAEEKGGAGQELEARSMWTNSSKLRILALEPTSFSFYMQSLLHHFILLV